MHAGLIRPRCAKLNLVVLYSSFQWLRKLNLFFFATVRIKERAKAPRSRTTNRNLRIQRDTCVTVEDRYKLNMKNSHKLTFLLNKTKQNKTKQKNNFFKNGKITARQRRHNENDARCRAMTVISKLADKEWGEGSGGAEQEERLVKLQRKSVRDVLTELTEPNDKQYRP
ncbi:hypothetical protein PoB_003413700 [Plakobranchus ocellatus]|uniref:Uncharacterized protein n=1 Tax=Plakobranchus ocellatus TaxID=259542 RepID=A0AAV4AL56_9GAST|nr:hypothetical protein PoB_003413700 [Plakobranchus ocellatus]